MGGAFPMEEQVWPGGAGCPGCGETIAYRHVVNALGPDTVVVPMQNGIPFWYFHKLRGPYEGHTLQSVDPGGRIGRAIPAERVIGCVVYPASELVAPGVVRHIEGDRFPLGVTGLRFEHLLDRVGRPAGGERPRPAQVDRGRHHHQPVVVPPRAGLDE